MEKPTSETPLSVPASPNARRILFIAYYFPPLGMGGTQRLAKWCKYLQREGWLPTVITVKPIAYHAYDESLLDDVKEVRIVRSGSCDPARLLFCWRRLHGLRRRQARAVLAKEKSQKQDGPAFARLAGWLSWLFVPDSRVPWLPFATWHAARLLWHEQYLAVVTSGPPHSSHFVGWFAKKMLGGRWRRSALSDRRALSWLADFRDSWSGGDFQPEPTPLHRWLNRVLERFILRRADVVTAISPRLVDELRSHSKSSTIALHLLPNGYDPEDFAKVPPVEKCFTVVFCGTVTAVAYPQTLIEGFRVFVERAQLGAQEARLRFVGADLTRKVATWVQENSLQSFVEITGYISHAAAVAAMRSAAVLVYVVAPGTSPVYVGGKTYEYLAARRPVLCIGEAVDGQRLLRQYASTRVCGYHAIDSIAVALLAFYREFAAGEVPPAPAAPEEFSRRVQARRLAALLTEHTHRQPGDAPP